MGEGQSCTRLQVRLDVLLVHGGLVLIRQQDHHNVGLGNGVGNGLDFQTLLLGVLHGLGGRTQADDDVDAGIAQVQRMGMALGTVTEDGDLLAIEHGQISVLLVPDSCCHNRRSFIFSFIAIRDFAFPNKLAFSYSFFRLSRRAVAPRSLLPPDRVRGTTPHLLRNCFSPAFFMLLVDVHIVVTFASNVFCKAAEANFTW